MLRRILILTALLASLLTTGHAWAEASEIRFAQQFSMGYLEFNVMKHLGLLEKHLAAAGLPPVKVTFVTFNGPDMMNDALLSSSIDVASGGVPGLLTIWSKTWHTAQEVRGISALSESPILLNSRNPKVHSITDLTSADRIALPAVKVAIQAALLEMAAAKQWGDANFDKLDSLTFSLSPPDATAGILSGSSDFNAAFTVPPYQEMQLKDPAVHTILSSYDVTGPSTGATAWTTKRFHDDNPKLMRALVDAMQEASDYIATHPKETVEFYAADSKAKIDTDLMNKLLTDPRYKYILTPHATTKWVAFMHKVGRIKNTTTSWKDLFWPEIYNLDGS
jgi:NitT/TauT family transport system substrate-binding protein